MNPLKPVAIKKSAKHERQKKVLLGLVELYISEGKPVGSNTLKENGFQDLSSATIRNYFASLESDGYLSQQHSSGGRVPTHKAFRLYAHEMLEFASLRSDEVEDRVEDLKEDEPKDIGAYLQRAADKLGELTQTAVFFSAPRFDQDFIQNLKLFAVDDSRCLCVIITDFGLVHTQVLTTEGPVSEQMLKRIERHFLARLAHETELPELSDEEEALAQTLYSEVMVRYIVGYANHLHEDVSCSGFSRLLNFSEFNDAVTLASALSLFENTHGMRLLLRECCASKQTKCWIGGDLHSCLPANPDCAVLATPYLINNSPVGAMGILGPVRLPYRRCFSVLEACAQVISETLTATLYKHKISYRQADQHQRFLEGGGGYLIEETDPILLEDKRKTRKKA